MNRFTLSKAERIYSKKQFEELIRSRNSFLCYPIRAVYNVSPLQKNEFKAGMAVSVSKKRFKKAVTRNRIKRLVRESYRLHKIGFYSRLSDHHIDLLFIFIGKELSEFKTIDKSISLILDKICNKINQNEISE